MSGLPGVRSVLAAHHHRDRVHVPWAYSLLGAAELPVWGPDHPLRREASRWVSWGGVVTVLLGLALAQLWREGPPIVAPTPIPDVRIIGDWVLPPPPSITGAAASPVNVSTEEALPAPKLAVPEPVPDDVAVTPTIPTFAELNKALDNLSAGLGDFTGVKIVVPDRAPKPAPAPFEPAAVDQVPVRLSCQAPAYPPLARSAMVEGTVSLNVKVGKDGRVLEVRVLNGPDLLREAAVASAWTARFRPAVFNGQAVEAWVGYPVTFYLRSRR